MTSFRPDLLGAASAAENIFFAKQSHLAPTYIDRRPRSKSYCCVATATTPVVAVSAAVIATISRLSK